MRFESTRFGTVEVDEDKLIHFTRGMPGFPDCRRFIVMDHDRETPIKWLHCLDDPDLAFLVAEPEQLLGSFEVEVPDWVLTELEWKESEDPATISVFLILKVQGEQLFANLRAPVVVNLDNRRAFQLIVDRADAPLAQPIAPQE